MYQRIISAQWLQYENMMKLLANVVEMREHLNKLIIIGAKFDFVLEFTQNNKV